MMWMDYQIFSFCFSFFTPLFPCCPRESLELAADLAADLDGFLTDLVCLASFDASSVSLALLAGSSRFLLNFPYFAMLTIFLELVFPLSFWFSSFEILISTSGSS